MILIFKKWCENIIIGVVITVIIEMICPDRFLKYIRVVTGIFVFYLIIAPIIDNFILIDVTKYVDDIFVNSEGIIYDNNINNEIYNIKKINKTIIEGVEIKIKDRIKKELGLNINIQIKYNVNDYEIIKLIVSGDVKDLNYDLIKNIILEEISIDDKLIVYNWFC